MIRRHGHLDLRRVEADPETTCAENMSRDYTDGIIGGLVAERKETEEERKTGIPTNARTSRDFMKEDA